VLVAGGVMAGVAVAATPGSSDPGQLAGREAAVAAAADHQGGTARSGRPDRRGAPRHAADPAAGSTSAKRARQDVSSQHGTGSQHGTSGQHGTRVSKPAPARSSPPHPTAPARPYLVYDSVEPGTIPAGQQIATYADGPYAISPSQLPGRTNVLWIDVFGTDPAASVLDVEPGCATPAVAAVWTQQRLTQYPNATAILYTMLDEWPQVQAAVAALPASMQSRIRWWIANPTGYPHVVPGSSATQWYWGPSYDISTALPGF
jgi:hypothetical protein